MTKIISKHDFKTARALGLKRYYTGVRCPLGHVGERYVRSRTCVICCAARKKEWADNNRNHIGCYNKKFHKENYRKNREMILLANRERRLRDPERTKAARKKEYQKNKERYRRSFLAYRLKNSEAVKLAHRLKVLANPERYAAYARNRKARVRAAKGSHTGEQIRQLLKLQNGKCAYCRDKIIKRFHVDHIIPIIRGGANDVVNLQLLCPPCNLTKSAKDPLDFAREKGMLL